MIVNIAHAYSSGQGKSAMSFIELLDRVLPRFRATPEDRSTRRAVRLDELSDEWVIALAQADYSHLPSRKDTPPPMR